MVSTSSGPVRRNFGPSGPSQSQRKSCSVFRVFFLTLIALVAALTTIGIHLSRQLMKKSSRGKSQRVGNSAMSKLPAEVKSSDISGAGAAAPVVPAPHFNGNSVISPNDVKDRVYCMIPFIWNEEIYEAIMETWGKRCDVVNFLTDAIVGGKLRGDHISEDPSMAYKPYYEYPEGTFPKNVFFINMTRTWNDCPPDKKGDKKVCRHIWEKMWRSWVFVQEHHLDQAEWFCKVDYDTFFFPDNVKHFVRHKHWNPYTEHHYFGHKINHRQKGREPMIAGATACWSYKTLNAIADVYRSMPKGMSNGERGKCEDRAQATEEASTSLCLKKFLNVSAYPARDDELREHITVAKYSDVLGWNRTEQGEWWYWKGKPKGAGEMGDAISVNPIGLHKYKQPNEIRDLEKQFFGPPDNKLLMRLKPNVKEYVKKVRMAMGVDK